MEAEEARSEDPVADDAALRALAAALRPQAGSDHFYIFWVAGGRAAAPAAPRQRTLLAFHTPDAALAFAQRNQLTSAPRLRRLALPKLVQAVLREPKISAIVFVADEQLGALPAGMTPPGVRVERAELLARLGAR